MKAMRSLGRLILLLALFTIGLLLILYIGHSLTPPKLIPEPTRKSAETEAAPTETPATRIDPSPIPIEQPVPETEKAGIVKTDRGRFVATEPILFNSGLSTMREASIPKLNRIAEFLIQNPDIELEIIGHTDNLGSEPVNQNVSAERAALVREYLISQGIDPSRLASKGMGSLDPIDTNETQLGRQANRRIEFLVKEAVSAGSAKGITE